MRVLANIRTGLIAGLGFGLWALGFGPTEEPPLPNVGLGLSWTMRSSALFILV